jgi:hypothetical protein
MRLGKAGFLCAIVSTGVLCVFTPAAAAEEASLFDGKTLGQWKVTADYDFKKHGKVEVKNGTIVLGKGQPGTAIRYSGKFPKMDYEIALDAMRTDGEDFFCGLTFPVGDRLLSLIVGGWGGRVVGLSCVDGEPAVENETCQYRDFHNQHWYHIRLRVTPARIEAWIDREKLVDLPTEDRKFTIWFEPESVSPLGIATWRTGAALRNISVRRLTAKQKPAEARPAGERPGAAAARSR